MEAPQFADLLPPLATDEYAALKAAIKEDGGVRDAVLQDEEGNILDGRHRLKIDPKAPRKTIKGLSVGEKQALVFRSNFARRNLSPAQKRDVDKRRKQTAKTLRAEGKTQKQIADLLAVPRETARDWLDPTSNGENAKHCTSVSATTYDVKVKVPAKHHERIVSRVESGEPQKQVAADYGVSQQTISGIVKKVNRKRKELADRKASLAALKGKAWELTDSEKVIKCNALITDPPYGVLVDQPWEPKDLEKFTRTWATRWASCDAECIAIFWSLNHLWNGKVWFDESLKGYHFQQLLAWHYPNSMMHKEGPHLKNSWDPVFFYLKDGATPDITVASDKWGKDLKDTDCCVCSIPQSNFNDDHRKEHPSQKPVGVMRWLVATLSTEGALVVDPFSGSGTTGIAAVQLGRRFYGIETNEEYRKLAAGRIAQYGKRDS